MGDDSSSWEDSSEDEALAAKLAPKAAAKKQTPKKGELKMRNEDADSWEDDSEEEPEPVAKATKADPGKGSAPAQAEWGDDSESEEEIQNQPKAKSTKKNKLLREKLRAREAKSKRSAANDFDDDSSSEEEVEPNAAISERNLQNKKGNAMLFGDDKGKKRKKKPQRRMKEVPKTLKELYPVNAESRLESAKDLKKFSNAISNYILDLSMGGVDQTGKVVKPVISPNQAKNFVCAIIQKSCDSLDFTQLADIRRQIDSQMTKFKNAEMNARKAKRRGAQAKQKAPRKIRVEKSEEPVYVDGSYNDTDFAAFF